MDSLFDLVLEVPLVPVEPPDHLLLHLHLLVQASDRDTSLLYVYSMDSLFDLVLEVPLVPVEPPDHLLLPLHLLVQAPDQRNPSSTVYKKMQHEICASDCFLLALCQKSDLCIPTSQK
jgi:hypothetical protein